MTIESLVHAVPSYVSRKTAPADALSASAYRYDPPPPLPLGGPVILVEPEPEGVAPKYQVKLR